MFVLYNCDLSSPLGICAISNAFVFRSLLKITLGFMFCAFLFCIELLSATLELLSATLACEVSGQ
jgi:hypothetical protein